MTTGVEGKKSLIETPRLANQSSHCRAINNETIRRNLEVYISLEPKPHESYFIFNGIISVFTLVSIKQAEERERRRATQLMCNLDVQTNKTMKEDEEEEKFFFIFPANEFKQIFRVLGAITKRCSNCDFCVFLFDLLRPPRVGLIILSWLCQCRGEAPSLRMMSYSRSFAFTLSNSNPVRNVTTNCLPPTVSP